MMLPAPILQPSFLLPEHPPEHPPQAPPPECRPNRQPPNLPPRFRPWLRPRIQRPSAVGPNLPESRCNAVAVDAKTKSLGNTNGNTSGASKRPWKQANAPFNPSWMPLVAWFQTEEGPQRRPKRQPLLPRIVTITIQTRLLLLAANTAMKMDASRESANGPKKRINARSRTVVFASWIWTQKQQMTVIIINNSRPKKPKSITTFGPPLVRRTAAAATSTILTIVMVSMRMMKTLCVKQIANPLASLFLRKLSWCIRIPTLVGMPSKLETRWM
mmetsp:Transcript_35226/g.85372  ORF Transcript_35226/g.85372 Transcript_35226/m.85372 type:complete len:272 (+) Transcript_35226:1496-2311(+)